MYDTHDEDYDKFELAERLNKSQQKREIQALLDLGKRLAQCDAITLGKFDLPSELQQALLDVQSMKLGAEKRQFKRICKLLRQINTEEMQETFQELDSKKANQDKQFHKVERWRDRLIEDGHTAVTEFMAKFPHGDAGQIRQLVRNANKEISQDKPRKSSRALFRLLRDTIVE
ncbi:DUF615 domain-containing protein [Mariprofundus sp. EBB-1]|uniref:ribosome biogenesis factor YjgA n=1 Tax=Mariprofundus sp. EBB-1 TaxID=2650971 RepID=UPI000EF247F9|nr:ribosome biogenesis factor YjgA [Mariprofundus sp. EBB-1]RLL50681.1 DUF615 domain-containing protein [Mariprofundus sp. EBB-1]